MKVRFEKSFQKDLRKIKDKNMLTRIKAVIAQSKKANALSEINGLIKLKGYNTFYRIRLGNYRIGLELSENELIFVRFLHRREIYKYFP